MKKYFILLFTTIISIISTGCLEVNTLVKVNKDGSGTVEETLLFSSEVVQMIKQFAESMPDSGTQKFSIMDEAKIKESALKMGEGVKFVSAKPLKKAGREGYVATFSFKDIRKLKINQSPDDKIPMSEGENAEGDKAELLTFAFQKGNPSKLTIVLPEKDFKKEKGEKTESEGQEKNDFGDLQKAKQFFKDMRISIAMQFNDGIKSTDASYVDGNQITLFDVNFGELLKHEDKLKLLKDTNPQSFEEAKEILKDIPGIRIEMNRKVSVQF
ncbi:MAG: hypothetical protein IPM56_15065 [Ignavibacteriales bacterium]|nr:MAG: hypothetical protein IPM56_15065 [Ignavibacteriales bacterium]